MAEHKFLTPRLGASFVITKLGLAVSSPMGWFLMLVLQPALNWLMNRGLVFGNGVVIEWTTARDQKEFDAQQIMGLDAGFVASLSPEQRKEKSRAFRTTFRKFVTFGFVRNRKDK